MIDFPTTPAPAYIRLRSNTPTRVSVAHSLKRQRRGGTAQAWGFVVGYTNVSRSRFAPVWSHSITARGQYDTFLFVPALIGTRQTAGAGTPVVATAASTGRSVAVKGMSAGAVLGKAGDFLKFAGHTKVYMLTADATADGAGNVTIAIEPALYAAVALNEALTLDNVPFTVGYASDLRETEIRAGAEGQFNFEVELVEILP